MSLTLWLNFTIHDCKKRNVLYEKKCRLQNQKKNGVYEIKCSLGKKWTTVGLREEEKKWDKVKKVVPWNIRKNMLYK